MRFRELRQSLQKIVIAGMPAAVGCAGNPSTNCFEHVEKSFVVLSPADPPLELRIESCRVDVDACADLCQIVMERAHLVGPGQGIAPTDGRGGSPGFIGPGGNAFDACSAEFEGDKVSVKVAYTAQNSGQLCPASGRL